MEAGSNGTACAAAAEYLRLGTCEAITGTKEQLQSYGLGIGVSFPGEPHGPARVLRVIDPRGLVCKIVRDYSPGRFRAEIRYPGAAKAPTFPAERLPGDVKVQRSQYGDTYLGTADALVARGLLQAHQLPGAPGMRKTRVTIYADGTVATCAPNTNDPRAKEPGAKWVHRAGPKSFSVHVVGLDAAEAARRESAEKEVDRQWLAEVRKIAAPAPLRPVHAVRALTISFASDQAAADQAFQRFLSRLAA